MKNLKIDYTMLSAVGFILALHLVSLFFGHKTIGYRNLMLFLGLVSVASFFLLKKYTFFKSIFLISYFGLFICLILMNIQLFITGYYERIINAIVPIAMCGLFLLYPFFARDDKKSVNVKRL